MKRRFILIIFSLFLILDIIFIVILFNYNPKKNNNIVKINEITHEVELNYNDLSNYKDNSNIDYVVINNNEEVLYKTKNNITETINDAIKHYDLILDITVDNSNVGKIIFYNNQNEELQHFKNNICIFINITLVLMALLAFIYFIYLEKAIIKPFKNMEGFALRVASGDLDAPLTMDKNNIFGAFTESFDIMRSELKNARLKEKEANDSKKELVAKLSHDIKTPVASIKACSELGSALNTNQKTNDLFNTIDLKTDQINSLVNNLFLSSVEELTTLDVNPCYIDSNILKELIKESDYLNYANVGEIPSCLIYIDKLRLQQVFDNIFSNSYKYANTKIDVNISIIDNKLIVTIEDYGNGVNIDEIPTLKLKFKRGSNSINKDGAGLGLYICDYFMKKMDGQLIVSNGNHGFKNELIIKI